jgi:hypothetical protein
MVAYCAPSYEWETAGAIRVIRLEKSFQLHLRKEYVDEMLAISYNINVCAFLGVV